MSSRNPIVKKKTALAGRYLETEVVESGAQTQGDGGRITGRSLARATATATATTRVEAERNAREPSFFHPSISTRGREGSSETGFDRLLKSDEREEPSVR